MPKLLEQKSARWQFSEIGGAVPYSYKLMSAAQGGDVLDERDLTKARDRRDAEDLATQA